MSQTGWQQDEAAVRWAQVKEILFEVFATPDGQQMAMAEKLCGSDQELFDEVKELLRQEEDNTIAIDQPAVTPTKSSDKIGRFHIEKEIGSGGMGTVYLARSQETGAKRVAIKTLHAPHGIATERFYRERQILANLEHPNIARLYEGGKDENGTPFLVMEFIEGEPITNYCDKHKLTFEARMRLFIKVCEAVDHAHQNLVVHRDIKPGNILVDESGEPKLLDFGIAKMLDPTEANKGLRAITATHMRPMTPSYAAPEQVLGEPITTLTDVYALGLLLYELLIGCRAQRLKSGKRAEMIDIIVRNNPPTFLQVKQDRTDLDWTDIAKKRTTNLVRMQAIIQPELQAILTKALQKKPEARYASARKFAEDVARPLNAEPAEAMAGHHFYFVWRTILSNFGQVFLAMNLVAITFIAVLVIWSANTKTRLEERRAQELAHFTVNMLAMAAPLESSLINDINQLNLPAAPLLDLAEQHLDELENQDPQRRTQLLHALGRVYQNKGYEQKANQLLEEALRLQQTLTNPKEEIEIRLTLLHHCFSLGMIDEGFAHIQRNRDLLTKVPEAPWQFHAKTLLRELEFRLEAIFFWRGDEQDLKQVHQQLEIIFSQLDRTSGPNYVEFLRLNFHFRMMFSSMPISLKEAEKAITKAVTIFGEHHVKTALIKANKAILLADIGRYQQSIDTFNDAIPVLQKSLGAYHPRLSYLYFFHAVAQINMGDIKGAEPRIADAQLIFDRTDMKKQWHKLSSLYILIYTLRKNGLNDQVEPLVLKGLEAIDDNPKFRAMASGFHILYAGFLVTEERMEPAGFHYRRALKYRREELGEDHYLTGYAYQGLGAWHWAQGDLDEARKLMTHSLTLGKEQGLRGTFMRIGSTKNLIELANERGEFKRAITLCDQILPEIDEVLGPNSQKAIENRILKCELWLEREQKEAAQETYSDIKARMAQGADLTPPLRKRLQALEQTLKPSTT